MSFPFRDIHDGVTWYSGTRIDIILAVHSGHIPFQDGSQEVGTFNLVVANTEPMFLYCATGPHCQEGQVMVINP